MKLTDRIQVLRSPYYRHKLAVSERKHLPVDSPGREDLELYHKRLERLGELFHDACFTWYLEGGNVLPLNLGMFIRRHADIDLGVFDENLGELERFLNGKGYAFFSRNRFFKPLEETPYDIFERTNTKGIRGRYLRRLYAIKVDENGLIDEEEQVIRELDLHVHHGQGDIVRSAKEMFALPYEWFEQTKDYETRGGYQLKVGSMKVFYFFKLGGGRPRHVFDRQVIEEQGLLSKAEIEEICYLRQVQNPKKP